MDTKQRAFRIWHWCAALLAVCATSMVIGSMLVAHAADSGFKTYLPLTASSQQSAPPSGGGNDDGAATWWLPYSAQDGAIFGTTQPNVAIDARGGMHISYSTFSGTDGGMRPAYYMECAMACGDQSRWSRVRISDNVVDVRLLLDTAGHPRLMIFADNAQTIGDPLQLYQYAACDRACGDAASWTITTVGSTMVADIYRQDATNHYFALDRAGHPGFVYVDVAEHDGHGGTFLRFCQHDPSTCNDSANWDESQIGGYGLGRPDLVYTPDGAARIAGAYTNSDQQIYKLLYIACDATCATGDLALLYNTNTFTSFSMRLDSVGNPRLAFYTGPWKTDLDADQMYYLWCDTACTDAAHWNAANLHTSSGNGSYLDLVLDSQERPRFVYKLGDEGTGYAWCSANCTTEQGTWQAKQIESRDTLEQDFPAIPIYSCSIATWTSGHYPALALDGQGRPRVIFVAKHQYAGTDTRPDHAGQVCQVHTDITLARFSMVQP